MYCPHCVPVFGPRDPDEYDICLGDAYSKAWMEDTYIITRGNILLIIFFLCPH